MSSFEAPRIVSPDADVTFGFAPRIAVSVWRGRVRMAHLDAWASELRAFIPRCEGHGYASITVIEPSISLKLPDDVRSASEKLQRECAPHIKCLAYLVESRGFVAATTRTIASGFLLVTRAPYPLKVFGSLEECALWAAPHVDVGGRDVERLVNRVRAGEPI